MEKPNIFLDLDDLIIKTKAVALSYINKKYGVQITYDEYVNNNDELHKIIQRHNSNFNLTFDEVYLDYGKNFLASMEWHEDVELMEDVQEVISLLSQKYTLWVVTARQKVGLNVINHLLNRHFQGCFKGIHCVYEWIEGIGYHGISKKDFISNVSGEKLAFIDDSPKEILRMKNIIPTYLFDQDRLYNSMEGVNRVQSWRDIGRIFL